MLQAQADTKQLRGQDLRSTKTLSDPSNIMDLSEQTDGYTRRERSEGKPFDHTVHIKAVQFEQ